MLSKAKAAQLAEYRRKRKAKEKMSKVERLQYKILLCDEKIEKIKQIEKREWERQIFSLLAEYSITEPVQLRSLLQRAIGIKEKEASSDAKSPTLADSQPAKPKNRVSAKKARNQKSKG